MNIYCCDYGFIIFLSWNRYFKSIWCYSEIGLTTDEQISRVDLFSRMIWPQRILFLFIFRALLKTKKDLKHTFISFSSFDNNKKGTPGVFFQLFLDSDNVKILSSTCHFELVKVNELISTQYNFNPFMDWDRLFTKNECLSRTWLGGSLRYYFTLFRIWVTTFRKSTYEFFFRPLFQTL